MKGDELEECTLRMVRDKKWRVVRNAKRAKKLRNRGEGIKWCPIVSGWIWEWEYRVGRKAIKQFVNH